MSITPVMLNHKIMNINYCCYTNEVLFFPPAEGPLKSWSAYKSRLILWSDFQDSFNARPWTLDSRALNLMKTTCQFYF